MTPEARRHLVANLLAAGKQAAAQEAALLRSERDPEPEFVTFHLKRYILLKFMLEEDCPEDNLMELSALSLQRTMKLDRRMLRELDQAAPCDHATSESTKKVLLLYAIQKDLDIRPKPSDLTEAVTVADLARVVWAQLQNPSRVRPSDGSAADAPDNS